MSLTMKQCLSRRVYTCESQMEGDVNAVEPAAIPGKEIRTEIVILLFIGRSQRDNLATYTRSCTSNEYYRWHMSCVYKFCYENIKFDCIISPLILFDFFVALSMYVKCLSQFSSTISTCIYTTQFFVIAQVTHYIGTHCFVYIN